MAAAACIIMLLLMAAARGGLSQDTLGDELEEEEEDVLQPKAPSETAPDIDLEDAAAVSDAAVPQPKLPSKSAPQKNPDDPVDADYDLITKMRQVKGHLVLIRTIDQDDCGRAWLGALQL